MLYRAIHWDQYMDEHHLLTNDFEAAKRFAGELGCVQGFCRVHGPVVTADGRCPLGHFPSMEWWLERIEHSLYALGSIVSHFRLKLGRRSEW